ncbi:hypothetical protein [Leucothrix mucor]|uniref:hypothetical protein n=1 Tax=Leucothrix mucor TaxID=45248 RepID=UPI0003B59A11|nr:hypothetical protein [Leucothrix mucor]
MQRLIGIFLLLISSSVFSENVEIFLTTGQASSIRNLDQAREDGDTLVFYYLDARENLEQKVNEAVTQVLQPSLDKVLEGLSDGDLSQLSEEAIGQQVVAHHQQHSSADLANVLASIMDAEYLAALNRAAQDQAYATQYGIAPAMLPAILLRGQVFPKVDDYARLRFP